jgi:hypothetical protein
MVPVTLYVNYYTSSYIDGDACRLTGYMSSIKKVHYYIVVFRCFKINFRGRIICGGGQLDLLETKLILTKLETKTENDHLLALQYRVAPVRSTCWATSLEAQERQSLTTTAVAQICTWACSHDRGTYMVLRVYSIRHGGHCLCIAIGKRAMS